MGVLADAIEGTAKRRMHNPHANTNQQNSTTSA
jgi:hypothetical protein